MNSDILGNEYDPDDPTILEFITIMLMLGMCLVGTVIARIAFHLGRFMRFATPR